MPFIDETTFVKPECALCHYRIDGKHNGYSFHGDANGYYHCLCEYLNVRGKPLNVNPRWRPKVLPQQLPLPLEAFEFAPIFIT